MKTVTIRHENGDEKELVVVRIEEFWAVLSWPLYGEIWVRLKDGVLLRGPRCRKKLPWAVVHLEAVRSVRDETYYAETLAGLRKEGLLK